MQRLSPQQRRGRIVARKFERGDDQVLGSEVVMMRLDEVWNRCEEGLAQIFACPSPPPLHALHTLFKPCSPHCQHCSVSASSCPPPCLLPPPAPSPPSPCKHTLLAL